jgi:hypothetical protein
VSVLRLLLVNSTASLAELVYWIKYYPGKTFYMKAPKLQFSMDYKMPCRIGEE